MFSPTETAEAEIEADLPPLPTDRWWGDHLRETRWSLELGRLLVDPLLRGSGAPRGDGRSVILMPGLGGGDQTLLVLAAWLRRIGYRPHLCGFLANVSCSERAVARVERRLNAIHRRGHRRVALIGHSRGGHYARALARRRPELVSHAISIGAGLRQMLAISYPSQCAARGIRAVLLQTGHAGSAQCMTESCDCAFARDFAGPFPADRVRLTSIYSKEDGVVRWESALVADADCVEVTGSHTGLVFNRKTYRAIAAALATPELSVAARVAEGG
jgi:pimeloyl-ACP methyl ester carboxylesterase